jgi:hypothetical protein
MRSTNCAGQRGDGTAAATASLSDNFGDSAAGALVKRLKKV